MKNRKKWIIIGAIAVVVIAVGAIGATRMNLSFGQNKKEAEEKQEVVRRGEFLVRVRESGNLRSFLEVDVRSNVEGEIVEIFVDEADPVKLGDPLLRIDEEQILEQRKQAEANRDARKPNFNRQSSKSKSLRSSRRVVSHRHAILSLLHKRLWIHLSQQHSNGLPRQKRGSQLHKLTSIATGLD